MKRVFGDERKIVVEKISEILAAKDYIIFAYIFGSFANKENFRDIDIGIYLSECDMNSYLNLELKLEGEIEVAVHMPIDVRIINGAPVPFVYNVLQNGKLIVDKNKLLRTNFESLIYKKYFDFQHLRNEYLREIKNAPF